MSRRTGIMLATPITPKLLEKLPEYCFAQPKLNGQRCRTILRPSTDIRAEDCHMFSSEGNMINSLPLIKEQLRRLKKYIAPSVIDGELYVHGMPRQTIQHIVKRGRPCAEHFQMEYHIFDVLGHETQKERLKKLTELIPILEVEGCTNIIPVTTLAIKTKNWELFCDEFVKAGYEGIILRHPDAPYFIGRSKTLLKFKPMKMKDFPVIHMMEAVNQYGVGKKMLGSLRCVFAGRIFNVGAFSLGHDVAQKLWLSFMRGDIKPNDFVATIRYPELSISGVPQQPILRKLMHKDGSYHECITK